MKTRPATKKDATKHKPCVNCGHAIYYTKWSGITCNCGNSEVLTK